MAVDSEAELRAAVADFQGAAQSLRHLQPILVALQKVLNSMQSPGQAVAQTTPAKVITEQPVHSGQIPEKETSEFGDHGKL